MITKDKCLDFHFSIDLETASILILIGLRNSQLLGALILEQLDHLLVRDITICAHCSIVELVLINSIVEHLALRIRLRHISWIALGSLSAE